MRLEVKFAFVMLLESSFYPGLQALIFVGLPPPPTFVESEILLKHIY